MIESKNDLLNLEVLKMVGKMKAQEGRLNRLSKTSLKTVFVDQLQKQEWQVRSKKQLHVLFC